MFQKIINTDPPVLVSLYQDEKEDITLRISCWEKFNNQFYFHEEVIDIPSIELGKSIVQDYSIDSANEFLKYKLSSDTE